ncbi:FtsX-like permease family protein [Paraburkholderia sp. D15]|uniref:ABC transporter permease n=1 Tax=Paraburkholderia sp. D15 TaxID=2880218 RepID=UPI0024796F5F|nr:FtsX-like permease family protein [Paraburkholderia sp. D15]WGS51930.1 FtsX-like permease family protein [Paraburkholderia sp. D15]
MKTLLLAFRNLKRNRRRSSTTMLAMISGLAAVLLFGGYTTDINYGLQSNYVRQSGHLQLQHSNYFLYGSGDPVSYGIDNYEHVIDVLRGDPQLASLVTVITPVLSVNGIAGNFSAGVSRTVFGVGMVVADQNRMRTWNDYGFPGRPSQLKLTGSGPDAAVIGTGVARVLRLCDRLDVPHCSGQDAQAPLQPKTVAAAPADIAALSAIEAAAKPKTPGAHIELLASNAYGAPNIAELNVVQAQRQGVKEVDDMFVQLHLPQAQRLVYGGGQPKVTAIEVQLHHTDQLPQARARLNALLSSSLRGEPIEVLDFATLNAQYGQITGMFGAVFGFIAVLIATVVMFTVSNTMNMAVMERTHEIGTLRAIGVRRAGIRRMFVYEGFLLGVCGAAVGVLCALGAAALINHAGLHWVPPGQTEPVALTVRVWGETAMIARYAIGVVLVATFSAWWPARRAARMPIVDSLRFA